MITSTMCNEDNDFILIKSTVRFDESSSLIDTQGRYAFVNGILDTRAVTLAVMYAPNSNQELADGNSGHTEFF